MIWLSLFDIITKKLILNNLKNQVPFLKDQKSILRISQKKKKLLREKRLLKSFFFFRKLFKSYIVFFFFFARPILCYKK